MGVIRRAWDWLTTVETVDIERDDGWLDPINVAFPGLELGGPVQPAAAFGLPAFYRALRIKSDLISTLPLRAQIDGQWVNAAPAVLETPDPTEDRPTTLSRLVASITIAGEGLLVPTGVDLAGPTGVKPVDPRMANLDPDRGLWSINGESYTRSEVMHLLPFAMPGDLRGVGAVTLHRRRLAAQLRATDYQDAFYRDSGAPSTLISIAKPGLDVDEMERYAAWYDAETRGRRKALVADGDTTITPWTLTNRDAQFIETMNYSLAECALMIGIPPYFVGGETASGTYTNAHFERRNLIDIHLRAELYAIERAFTALLPDGVVAKFDTTSFLRADPVGTVTALAQQTWLTADEKRAVMGYPPLTDAQRAELDTQPAPVFPTDPAPMGGQA